MAKKIFFLTLPPLLIFFLFFPQKEKTSGKLLADKVSTKAASPKKESSPKIVELKEDILQPKEVENALATTNLWEDLKSIDSMMEDRLEVAREILPPEQFEKLEKTIQENFSSSKFIEEIKKHLANKLSREDLLQLKNLTEDPFLKKIWDLQTAANSPEAIKDMEEFEKEFIPTPERDRLAREYERKSRSSEKSMQLNSELLKGIFQGASSSPLPPEQLNLIASRITEKISSGFIKSALIRFHYTYQDLSDSELALLIEKEENPTLAKTEDLIHEKLKELLFKGGEEMGRGHKGMTN